MRALIQRVREASVTVQGVSMAQIGPGLLIFLGLKLTDGKTEAEALVSKILNLRIFEDDAEKMNRSILEVQAEILVVSQFTLYGNCSKGRRPSFEEAMKPEEARKGYEYFLSLLSQSGLKVEKGRFQEMMQVSLVNEGPVTFLLET